MFSKLRDILGWKRPIQYPSDEVLPAQPTPDPAAWRRIRSLIDAMPDPGNDDEPEPVLTLDDFFAGNVCIGSLAANLDPTLPAARPAFQHDVLRHLLQRPQTHAIYVAITDTMEYGTPEEAEAQRDWPYSDHVYVVTQLGTDDVAAAVAKLSPDEVREGWCTPDRPPDVDIPLGHRVVCVWWD